MKFGIRKKIFLTIFFFLMVSLSALLVMRVFIVRDFKHYTEGGIEDKAYWLTAMLEGRFERDGKFARETAEDAAVSALVMGFEFKLFDNKGELITDTERALDNALPLTKRRLSHQAENLKKSASPAVFVEYPLFLSNNEIGEAHLRYIGEWKSATFLSRTDLFLAAGFLIAVLGSLMLSFALTATVLTPIARLHRAAKGLAEGKKHIAVDDDKKDELGELAKAFNGMSNALEAKEKARKTSMAKFAHELRTPLTIMQAELEGMTDGVIPMNKERLASLQEELERLKKLITALESLYRLEKEAERLELEHCNIRDILLQIVKRFEMRCREKGIEIEAVGENFEAETDRSKLTQILINLTANAAEATEKGKITLSAAREENGFMITVTDTGKGIKEEDMPFIFERFYGNSGNGLGLGLAIVKELVDALGGTIDVESAVEQGTTFLIRLPDVGKAHGA